MPPTTDDLLATLTPEFERNFSERNELGAGISIHHRGIEILNLSHGIARPTDSTAWTADTLVPVWSATKGPAAVATLHALHQADIPLDQTVAHLWPAFAKAGKSTITFAQLLSHNGGLSALDKKVSIEDFDAVIEAIENQAPNSSPGTQQAYHARTFGFLLDQIVRLAAHAPSLGHYFDTTFRQPMNLDFWIGLPAEQNSRVAQLQPAKIKAGTQPDAFMKAFTQPGSLTQRTFASPTGLGSVRDINRPEIQQLGLASFGGVGSARGLSAFYAMLANEGQWNGQTFVDSSIIHQLQSTLSQQTDAVLQSPVAFAAGVMRDPVDESTGKKLRQIYSQSRRAFGHPGAGGSLAFADPARQLSFAYVMNQMEPGALPNEKSLGLVRLLDQIWPV
jgi:CubicO group peptidase (beta-lactamase class C family)